jgi:hypothetical protein
MKLIHSGINFLLKPFGYILREMERDWERDAFAQLYEARIKYRATSAEHPAAGIVFSKDRALQLHALLSSYSEKVSSPAPLYIFYHTSTPRHQKAYAEVMEIFSHQFKFIKQSSADSFRSDLLTILDTLSADKIFFLVDDLLFIENVDLSDFTKFNTDDYVPTLRMGLNLTEAYTIKKKQPLPDFITVPNGDDNKIFWRWNDGIHGWSYPLSLDGHFFCAQEIKAITRLIGFSAPNSYEDRLQKFRRFFLFRMGVGYKKSKIVNIPCNKVQNANKNICGNIHQDDLLERWLTGYQMNYRALYGVMNTGAHQEIPFELIKR